MPKYINDYKIVDRKQGGMAVVYKGVNSNGFTRAFKVVRPDKAANNPALCQKFLKGIQILQQLDHPNIVRALNAFTYTDDENGSMEYEIRGFVNDYVQYNFITEEKS